MQEMELEKSIGLLDKDLLDEIDNQPITQTETHKLFENKLKDYEDSKNSNDNANEEESCKEKLKRILFNIKDYIFPFILLVSCCPNFSYLNLIYSFIGLLYPFLLLIIILNSKRVKLIIEIFALVYSVLSLIFKITIISLKITWSKGQKETFLNLGVSAIKTPRYFNDYITTFLGDSCVVTISLLSLLITLCCSTNDNSRPRIVSPIRSRQYQVAILWLIVINCIMTTSCNLSYISIAIALMIHLALFLWATKETLKPPVYEWLYFLMLIVFIFQLILTHIMNINNFLDLFENNFKYFLSYFGILQINGDIPLSPQMQLAPEIKASMSYVFISSGIILLLIGFKVLSLPVAILNNKNDNKEKDAEEDKKKKSNTFIILLRKFGEYLISPYFILHFCRIGLIVWVYFFRNYESIILLLYLFVSFLLLRMEKLFFVSQYIIYPVLAIVGYLFQWSNINFAFEESSVDDNRIKQEHYGLYIYKYEVIENAFIQVVIIFFVLLIKAIETSKRPKKDSSDIKGDLSILIEQEEQNDIFEDEDIEKKKRDFSFSALIIKFLIGNIDKITLVIMYFIAIGKVNISHCLLTIIFMIQLLNPNTIVKICYGIMIFLELIFSCEYAFDLAKVYLDNKDTKLFDLIKVFIDYSNELKNNSLEFLLFLAVYCFYVQYQNYNYALYKNIVLKSNYTFEAYLNEKCKNHPYVLRFLLGFVDFILEFYVWILIVFCFFFNCFFEITLLFNIKLALFLFLCFQFLSLIQTNGKKRYKSWSHWLFMLYCMLNTMIVYFYQFGTLEYLKESFRDVIDFIFRNKTLIKNLPVIGLQLYKNDNLVLKFLPHFAMNFLSVLFYWEIQRITKNLKDKLESNKLSKQFGGNAVKVPMILAITEPKKPKKNTKPSLKSKDKQMGKYTLNIKDKEIKAEAEIEIEIQDVKEERNEEVIKQKNQRTVFLLKFQHIIYEIIILFTKIYWLLLFLCIFIIYTTYSLSLSMIIYLFIFGVSFSLMYRRSLRSVMQFLKTETFFISKLVRHNLIEISNSIKTLKWHRKIAFRILLSFSIIYIILTYFYAVYDIMQNNYATIISDKLAQYIQAIAYICGIYVNVNKTSFFNSIWVHLFLIAVVSLDVYIQKLQNFISKKSLEISKLIRRLEYEFEIELNEGDINTSLIQIDSGDKINESIDSGRKSFSDSFCLRKKMKTESEVIDEFLNIFKNMKNKKRTVNLKNKNHRIGFLKMIKAVLEEVIVLMLILTSISKLSIWSFIYMGIVLYLFYFSKRTLITFYCLLNVLIISIFIQACLFLSNISDETAPNPNDACLKLIEEKLGLPWFSSILDDGWGFFLGMGVNFIQIKTLWLDFIEVVIICVYLDLFSYSIYQDIPNRGSVSNKTCKISYHNLSTKKGLRTLVQNLSDEEYEAIKTNFYITFDIQLCSYAELQKYFEFKQMDKGDLQHALLNMIKPKKKSKSDIASGSMTKMLFLSMHNIVLTIIIILSIMVSGLISAIYISFSLIYLLDSTSIIRGTKSSYPKGIKTTLRNLILVDIIIQLIIQMPINTYLIDTYVIVLKTIGINQIMNYIDPNDSRSFKIDGNELFFVNVKAFTFFIMSLQVYFYSSRAFQEFYFNYVLKKNNLIRKRSLINSFLFNNRRIEQMNTSIEKRIQMTKAMNQLEQTLIQWNSQLGSLAKPALEDINKELQSEGNAEDGNADKIKEEVKAHLLSGMLIKLWIWMHRHNTNYAFTEPDERLEFETSIIKGRTITKLEIEKEVDEFVDQLDGSLISLGTKDIIKVIDDFMLNDKVKEEKEKHDEEVEIDKEEDEKEEDVTQKEKLKKSKRYLFDEGDTSKDELIDTTTKKKGETKNKNADDEDEDIKIVSREKPKQTEDNSNNDDNSNIKSSKSFDKQLDPNKEQLVNLLSSTIKLNNFKTSNVIGKVLSNSFIYFLNNSETLCFIIMIIHHMVNGSLISLFYPLAVFGMGILEYPRSSKLFWNICLMYSTIILIIKFVIQFYVIQTIPFLKETIFGSLTNYKIGLTNFKSTFSSEFFFYIFFDALILFMILIQEYILITKGIWEKNEASIESIKEGHERIFKANLNDRIENIKEFNNEYLLAKKDSSDKSSLVSFEINKNPKKSVLVAEYLNGLFPKVRNEKPGKNYYVFYTIPLLFIIIYLIVFYTNMEQDKINGFTNLEDVTKNSIKQFSGIMVIFVLIHVVIAVIDRVIYIRQNRNELTFEYLFSNKETGQPISQKEMNIIKSDIKSQSKSRPKEAFEIPIETLDLLKVNYNIILIQNETTNWPLIAKYILHWATLVFSHLFIFFYLPMQGNYNLQTAIYCESKDPLMCNDFTHNVFIIIFYLIYLVYLLFSALQIKNGLLDLREKSLLKTTFSSMNGIIFKTIKAIPFLYELKLSIDWTFTSTCLDLFQWNKFEKIYDVLYTTTCAMKYVATKPVGNKIGKFMKAIMGGLLFIAILLILIIPLLLFSTLNPTNEVNKVTGAAASLSIIIQDKESLNKTYILFENNQVENIYDLKKESDVWKNNNYSDISQTKNFPADQIQVVQMGETTDNMWDIATPHKESIIAKLNDVLNKQPSVHDIKTISFGYDYFLTRPNPPETKESKKHFEYLLYKKYDNGTVFDDKSVILKTLHDGLKECTNSTMDLNNFYKAGIRLYAIPHPKVIQNSNWNNVSLIYYCLTKQDSQHASYFSLGKNNVEMDRERKKGIEFHVFSDKVSATTASYSIITFFTTYILLAGMYLGNFFAGEAERVILTEMPEPEKLVNLCEGIQISRYSHQLEKEEHLYYMLIEFMRSPEYLRLLTKSSLRKFKERRELLNKEQEDNYNNKNEPNEDEENKSRNSDNEEEDKDPSANANANPDANDNDNKIP